MTNSSKKRLGFIFLGFCSLLTLIPGIYSSWAVFPAVAADAESKPAPKPKQEPAIWHQGDWQISCAQPAKGAHRCVMAQAGIDQKTKRQVFTIRLSHPAVGKPLMMELQAPLGVHVGNPAAVLVDEGTTPVVGLGFVTCLKGGCIAVGRLNDDARHAFETGTKGKIVVKNVAGKNIEWPLSLKGFTAAVKKLEQESGKN